MRAYYLWLVMCFGAGSEEIWELLDRFDSPKEVYEAFKNNCSAAGRELNEKAEKYSIEDARKQLSELSASEITAISLEDEEYPEVLKETENPPVMLFVKGNREILRNKLLTVVGARKITPFTYKTQERICKELISEYTLVTTLSHGCDRLSAMTSLCEEKPFIEIMPCSLNYEYPRYSNVIRQENIRRGGCSITEYFFNTPSANHCFLKRSRILGGISAATLVFQAGIGSGALRTASFSKAPFFLPPYDLFAPEYGGAVSFIRRGALIYFDKSDLETAYDHDFSGIELLPEKKRAKKEKRSETTAPKTEKALAAAENNPLGEESFESELHYKVYKIIHSAESAVPFDIILHKTETDIAELSEILLDLEIEGIVSPQPGNRFAVKV